MNYKYSTPSQYSISNLQYKNIYSLPRYAKGYFYEMELQDIADRKHIEYTGNPRHFEEWTRHTGKGYDMKVKTKDGTWISLEFKFTLKHVAHCWFMRDWNSRSADIFVTSDIYNVSYHDRRLLEQQHKKLLSTTEFAVYLDNLMKDGNHYYKWNTLIISISSIIKRIKYIFSAETLDKWIGKEDKQKQKQENVSGDSESLKERLRMAEEDDNTTRVNYPKRKRKGILRLCERCGSTFISFRGETLCEYCREDEDDSTKTFGSVIDGLLHPLE